MMTVVANQMTTMMKTVSVGDATALFLRNCCSEAPQSSEEILTSPWQPFQSYSVPKSCPFHPETIPVTHLPRTIFPQYIFLINTCCFLNMYSSLFYLFFFFFRDFNLSYSVFSLCPVCHQMKMRAWEYERAYIEMMFSSLVS